MKNNYRIRAFKFFLWGLVFCNTIFAAGLASAKAEIKINTNLVNNQSFEKIANFKPVGWAAKKSSKDVAAFIYSAKGYNGGRAARIDAFKIAKPVFWYFNPVAVTGGDYEFSNYYKATTKSNLTAEFILDNRQVLTIDLAEIEPSQNWKNNKINFTVPDNANKITIYQKLIGKGTLITDAYSLKRVNCTGFYPTSVLTVVPNNGGGGNADTNSTSTPNVDPGINPKPNDPGTGLVNLIRNNSLENEIVYEGRRPLNWSNRNWGENNVVWNYPTAGYDGEKAARVEVLNYVNGDAKWYFDEVAVKSGYRYLFSDYYKASAPSVLTIRYKTQDGAYLYTDLAALEGAASWTKFEKGFTVPAGAVSLTIFHLLNQNGWLEVDNYSLAESGSAALGQGMVSLDFDDGWLSIYQKAIPILNTAGMKTTNYIFPDGVGTTGYMTLEQLKEVAVAGNEIGNHSKSHSHLATTTEEVMQAEVSGAKDWFVANGITTTTFSYPYGEYNATLENILKNTGYIGARTSNPGYNDKDSDKYLLAIQIVDSSTTIGQIKAWIDTAAANKQWLILVFHEVDENIGGGIYYTTSEIIKQTADYLKNNNIKVVTESEGIGILGN